MINLDTNILLNSVSGRLRPRERDVLERDTWSISSIVLWEIEKLAQLGRTNVNLDDQDIVEILRRAHIWPIDAAIAQASTRLDFRSDPADEIIAATSIVHNIPLLTRDRVLLRSRVTTSIAEV